MDIRFTTQDGVVFCESTLEGEKIQEIKEIGATHKTNC